MKKIFALIIPIVTLTLASCSVSHQTISLKSANNQQLLAGQTLVTHISKDSKMSAIRESEPIQISSVSKNETGQKSFFSQNKPSFSSPKGVKMAFGNNNLSGRIEKAKQIASNLVSNHKVTASIKKSPAMPELNYKQLWIYGLIGTIVFLVLSSILVHVSLLALLFGILGFICLLAFLLFLALYLNQKKMENDKKEKQGKK